MLHVTTPVVAQKYGELFLVHRLFSVTTILSQDLFNTNICVCSQLVTQVFKFLWWIWMIRSQVPINVLGFLMNTFLLQEALAGKSCRV